MDTVFMKASVGISIVVFSLIFSGICFAGIKWPNSGGYSSPYIDIRTNGAVDGKDSTAAIQKTINDLQPGQVLYVPGGTFIYSTLTLKNNIIICGEGFSSVLKRKDGASDTGIVGTGISNLEIYSIKFDGNNQYVSSGNILLLNNLFGGSGENISIHDCWFYNAKIAELVILGNYSNVSICKNIFEWDVPANVDNTAINLEWNSPQGASNEYASNVFIKENIFKKAYWGAYISGGRDIYVTQNKFIRGAFDDITVYAGDGVASSAAPVINNIHISDNISENGNNFIRVDGWPSAYQNVSRPTRVSITNNTIDSPSVYGIYAADGLYQSSITGNKIFSSGDDAIKLERAHTGGDCTENVIADNIIKGPGARGIDLRQGCSYNIVMGNIIEGAVWDGILLDDSSNNNDISNNIVKNSGWDGIHINTNNAENNISNNKFENNSRYGVNITSITSSGNRLHYNILAGNTIGDVTDYGMGNIKIMYGPSSPLRGQWGVGDIVINTRPAAGGNYGWICVSSGTPGTWKNFGAISF